MHPLSSLVVFFLTVLGERVVSSQEQQQKEITITIDDERYLAAFDVLLHFMCIHIQHTHYTRTLPPTSARLHTAHVHNRYAPGPAIEHRLLDSLPSALVGDVLLLADQFDVPSLPDALASQLGVSTSLEKVSCLLSCEGPVRELESTKAILDQCTTLLLDHFSPLEHMGHAPTATQKTRAHVRTPLTYACTLLPSRRLL
jgi:hypothetical protein